LVGVREESENRNLTLQVLLCCVLHQTETTDVISHGIISNRRLAGKSICKGMQSVERQDESPQANALGLGCVRPAVRAGNSLFSPWCSPLHFPLERSDEHAECIQSAMNTVNRRPIGSWQANEWHLTLEHRYQSSSAILGAQDIVRLKSRVATVNTC